MTTTPLDHHAATVRCCQGYAADYCICPDLERVVRAVIYRGHEITLSAEEREYVLEEIDTFEGESRAEHETDTDRQLLQALISAWSDYASGL